jgi:hypothetical protein
MNFIRLPKEVLDLFPMCEYRCPGCLTYTDNPVDFCNSCGHPFDVLKWRVPPRFLKNYEAMSEYAHKVLAPKLAPDKRRLLLRYFTVYFDSGFETEDDTFTIEWDGKEVYPGNSLSVVTDQVFEGAKSAKAVLASSTSRYARCFKNFTELADCHCRMYVRQEAVFNCAFLIFLDGAIDLCLLRIANATTVSVYNYIASEWYSAAATIQAGTWYCFEMRRKQGDASTGTIQVWLDGALILDKNPVNTGSPYGTNRIRAVGAWGYGTGTIWVDGVVVADTYIGLPATLTGVTRDSNGNPLGGCTVWLFRTSDKKFIAETVSDANGNYTFTVSPGVQYFVRAHKDGVPNVFGTTDRDLVGS